VLSYEVITKEKSRYLGPCIEGRSTGAYGNLYRSLGHLFWKAVVGMFLIFDNILDFHVCMYYRVRAGLTDNVLSTQL